MNRLEYRRSLNLPDLGLFEKRECPLCGEYVEEPPDGCRHWDCPMQQYVTERTLLETDIDREVAENVMGWTLKEYKGWYKCDGEVRLIEDWSPSTRIDHAWQVLEKFERPEIHKFGDQWHVALLGLNRVVYGDARAETAPLAICHAALAMVKDQPPRMED